MGEPTYRFDAGRVSLDLLATLGNRNSERLADPAALDAWLLEGGLVEEACGAGAADLAQVRALRGAVFRVVDAELGAEPASAADLETLNAEAAIPAPAPRLVRGPDGVRREQLSKSVAEILGEIARDAIDLLTGPQRHLLRECAAPDCSGIYVDTSRGGTRRWCSTARCGNRARVAAHRARRRDGGEGIGA